MPDIGQKVNTPEGEGKVVGLNLLERVLEVRLFQKDRTLQYTWEELQS